MNENNSNLLTELSNAMAEAVTTAGASTVLVNARHRFPASGVAYAPDLVITASHVVERDEDISVILPDGDEVKANLAGRDPGSDLAVLRLEKAAVAAASKAPQDARVGELVLALGRPTTEGIQASLGVISAIGGPLRTRRGAMLDRYLRTDAIPYPGFSGGPLVNAAGLVIGINTSGFVPGASLAIPAYLAWQAAASLSEFGRVKRGYLGIRSQPVEIPKVSQDKLGRAQSSGLLIVGVEPDSAATAGGLMVGDIIVGLAGIQIADHDALLNQLSGNMIGKPAAFEILRGGDPKTMNVVVGERSN